MRPARPVGDGPRWLTRLLTTRGLLVVRPCPLCAALVVEGGQLQHDAQHRADARRGGAVPPASPPGSSP